MRNSADADRVFWVSKQVAADAGLIGVKRVLDFAPLFDAVTTQEAVTLICSAIRELLRVADPSLAAELRAACSREDDYTGAGKPVCDWNDAQAREELIDALVRDGLAVLAVLEGRELIEPVV